MAGFKKGLKAAERVVIAVDTSEKKQAKNTLALARDAGAVAAKMGLEISTATSWKACSKMAAKAELDWVADAKLDDIKNTTEGAVRNLLNLDHPPVAITIHTNSGTASMKAAQELAAEAGVVMLGVTHLTPIEDAETKQTYGFLRNTLVKRRLNSAVAAGIGGLVCSGRELQKVVQKDEDMAAMISMIPGTRSVGAASHDQANIITPEQAIVDGADLLVIGRQVTAAEDPAAAYEAVVTEIASGLTVVQQRQTA